MKVLTITSLRNNNIHISALMLMCFIHQLREKHNSAYLGEIHCYYLTKSVPQGLRSYTENGMYQMLYKLRGRGYVNFDRATGYSLTVRGQFAVLPFVGKL